MTNPRTSYPDEIVEAINKKREVQNTTEPVAVTTPVTPEPVVPVATEPVAVEPVTPEPVVPVTPDPVAPAAQDNTIVDTQVTKDWFENPEFVDPLSPTPTQQTPTVDPLLEDPEVKLFLEAKKGGKTLKDVVESYRLIDPTGMDETSIVRAGYELQGIKGDDLDNAMFQYEQAGDFIKNKILSDSKSTIDAYNTERITSLSAPAAQYEEAQRKIVEKFETDVNQHFDAIKNQELYGFKITDEVADELKNYVTNEFDFRNPDGTLNVPKMIKLALFDKHANEIVKANVVKAKNLGREEVLKEVTNPSPVTPASTNIPQDRLADIRNAVNAYNTQNKR